MNVIKYSAINAKIHALKSNLLKPEDYAELIEKSSVPDIVRFLQTKDAYAGILAGREPESIHRRDLELLIRNYLITVLKKLTHLFKNPEREIVILLIKRYEVENLKLALRNALTEAKSDIRDFSLKFYNLESFSSIEPEKVAMCKNTEEVLEALSGSPYQSEIRHVLESQSAKTGNLVYVLETALDKWYVSKLKDAIGKLGGRDKEDALRSIGIQIDLKNMEWIVRVKKFYGMSPEELYNSLFHTGYRLKKDFLRMACDTKGVNEVIEFLKSSAYTSIFTGLEDSDTLPFELTKRIKRYLFDFVTKNSISNEFSFAKLFEYIYLLEFEVNDIIMITEAIRYSLKKNEILPNLARELEGVKG